MSDRRPLPDTEAPPRLVREFKDIDVANERRLDVFMGDFEMCHKVPLMERLEIDAATLPLAELLLTKLQVIELNERDLVDILLLLVEHDVADGDDGGEAINAELIARLCARDWGLWRTIRLNVERTRESAGDFGLSEAERERVLDRLDRLWARIEAEPKSSRWRLRDRVGDRKRWYEKPEET